MPRFAFASLVGIGMILAGVARAEDWPQWRGPHLNGSSESKDLPDTLDKSGNLQWTTNLPGMSASSPIISGDNVFVSCIDSQSNKLLAMCLNRKDGHVTWQKEVGVGFQSNDRNNMASPSPVTDGKNVWFYYGTGDLAAFDMTGKELWSRNLQKDYGNFSVQWIYASSPLFYDGKVYVQVLHRSENSYLLCVEGVSGKELWRQARPEDARGETKESYATPILVAGEGRSEIVLIGGDVVTAHDPASGKELWRCGGWNPSKINHWRIVSSVVSAGDLIVACPPKGGKIFAIKDGGSGDVTETGVAWKSKEFSTDVCVPLYYKGNLYVLDGDRKHIACLDPKTGEKKWSGDLGGSSVFRASPTGADNKIYCINESGEVWVLSADEFKILSKTVVGARPTRGTIAVVDGQAIVHTADKIYAFGKAK